VVGNGSPVMSFDMAVQRRAKHLFGSIVRRAGPPCSCFSIDGMRWAVKLYIEIQ